MLFEDGREHFGGKKVLGVMACRNYYSADRHPRIGAAIPMREELKSLRESVRPARTSGQERTLKKKAAERLEQYFQENNVVNPYTLADFTSLAKKVSLMAEPSFTHTIALSLTDKVKKIKPAASRFKFERAILAMMREHKWPTDMPKPEDLMNVHEARPDNAIGLTNREDQTKLDTAFWADAPEFLGKARAFINRFIRDKPLASVRQIRYVYNEKHNKNIIIFGEEHTDHKPRHSKPVDLMKKLCQHLQDYNIEFMLEDVDTTELDLDTDDELVGSIDAIRAWADPCYPRNKEEDPSRGCPKNVRFSWIDPEMSEGTDINKHMDFIMNPETVPFRNYPDDLKKLVPFNEIGKTHQYGDGTFGEKYIYDEFYGEKAKRLEQECNKASPPIKLQALKALVQDVDQHEEADDHNRHLDRERIITFRMMNIQRITMDAFTLCRIMRPPDAPGWKENYIVYEGAWHCANLVALLEQQETHKFRSVKYKL